MHKRMRRGKEMYPSFDTRRVLCKQHGPYCVKPLRAHLKPSNASNAESILSVVNERKRFGCPKSIVLTLVDTKTSVEGQSIGVWNAMSQLAFASQAHPGLSIKQEVLFAVGENITVLKLSQSLLTKPHWRKGLNGHGVNGLN